MTSSFYVPEIGDRFTLVADWHFTLYGEHRNQALIDLLGLTDDGEREKAIAERERLFNLAYQPVVTEIPVQLFGRTEYRPQKAHRVVNAQAFAEHNRIQAQLHAWPYDAVMPAGTELQVDRIYIRKGAKDFSSMSFYVVESPLPILAGTKKSHRRFWAKLPDCNRMQIVREEAPQLALAS